MRTKHNDKKAMKRCAPILFLSGIFLLNSCSQEIPENRILTGNDTKHNQNTNEPVTGIVESFYSTGQLKNRTTYKNGKKEGLDEGFHTNGQLSYRWNYKDGKPDGLEKTFDEDGRL
ncbi:uncharacterized protein METZ01_LOCUS138863, partial [marine metagenome]